MSQEQSNQELWTLGIEEEYLLVDRESGALAEDPPEEILLECQRRHEGQVSPEFLRSQIEVGTEICRSLPEAREQLAALRSTIAEVAGEYGFAPIAASTHPFARWHQQKPTSKARYATLASELQGVGRRLVICGMHIHVGVPDPEHRIDLMNQVRYFVPHILAFSTSSPFWTGRDTGLKSYRLSVFDGLPRTGLPEPFDSYGHYERYCKTLVEAGIIADTSKLWWDVRPNATFPTLEMRIADVSTRLDDGMAIAALYICLIRCLTRLRRQNQRWRSYQSSLIAENRWRAQRYGLGEGLIDLGRRELVSWPQLLDEFDELLREDAAALGCEAELAHLRVIHEQGTSAHRQLDTFYRLQSEGASEDEALRGVVQQLIRETVEGL